MKFKNISIGDKFDFISPNIGYNSFFKECEKVSPRCCEIYHVDYKENHYKHIENNYTINKRP